MHHSNLVCDCSERSKRRRDLEFCASTDIWGTNRTLPSFHDDKAKLVFPSRGIFFIEKGAERMVSPHRFVYSGRPLRDSTSIRVVYTSRIYSVEKIVRNYSGIGNGLFNGANKLRVNRPVCRTIVGLHTRRI